MSGANGNVANTHVFVIGQFHLPPIPLEVPSEHKWGNQGKMAKNIS